MDNTKRLRTIMANGMTKQASGLFLRATALRELAKLDTSAMQLDHARNSGKASRFEDEARALILEAQRLLEGPCAQPDPSANHKVSDPRYSGDADAN